MNDRKIFTFTCIAQLLFVLLIVHQSVADRGIAIKPASPEGYEVKGDQWL